MSKKHRLAIKEITDEFQLSLVSGGSAEHDNGQGNNSGGNSGSSGNGHDAYHDGWSNIMNGIGGIIGRNCNDGNFADGPEHIGTNNNMGCAGW
ncbi:hypothetical protein [Buttiauxella ferragutiae]|uniref:hypothetical protein n=1 Tax=Buttiauxella ferragutiae TaxID=82989 RepID=UPI001F53C78C|nr:hypothetical protein [Buttiauxella ferragutiae]UNK60964.1 hypothetical protein MNO13_21900 [Buttiauxella ferragutiae]